MKVRLPKTGGAGMNNLQQLAQKAQKMQEEIDKATKELEAKEYSATSGGGAVKVTIVGKPEIKNIEIKPEVVDKDDLEMLSDLIIAACNESIKIAEAEKQDVIQKISGQMNMPNIF